MQNTIGVFVTIFSYDGGVHVSMSADDRLVTQAEARRITGEFFAAEIDRLHGWTIEKVGGPPTPKGGTIEERKSHVARELKAEREPTPKRQRGRSKDDSDEDEDESY